MDSQTTNQRERVEVAEGDEPATAHEDTAQALAGSIDPSASLILRMWRAELDIGRVEKSQTATVKIESGGQYTYQFSGHDLIVAAVRPALARHGIKVIPTMAAHERIGNMTMATVDVAFINVDDPEDQVIVRSVNYGADKGDKGASKAFTNAVREGLKKGLGITSIDDGRADETTDFESQEGATRKEVNDAKEQRRGAIEQWAKTFKSALEKSTTLKDIQRLERENADQLAGEDLPSVTRVFFIELIEAQKAKVGK